MYGYKKTPLERGFSLFLLFYQFSLSPTYDSPTR
jgi:hypothetical protein